MKYFVRATLATYLACCLTLSPVVASCGWSESHCGSECGSAEGNVWHESACDVGCASHECGSGCHEAAFECGGGCHEIAAGCNGSWSECDGCATECSSCGSSGDDCSAGCGSDSHHEVGDSACHDCGTGEVLHSEAEVQYVEQPAVAPEVDTFSNDPVPLPTVPSYPATDAEPATEPATEPDSDSSGDIFDDPPVADEPAVDELMPEPEPMEEPAEEDSVDDLFGPADPAEDPFPSADPQPTEPTADEPAEPTADSQDDAPAEEPVTEEPPAEEPPADDEASDEPSFEDLFNQDNSREILREPGGLASDETRLWSDNSGRYGCFARLVRVSNDTVTLHKSHGGERVVPLARLSADDLRFVHRQVVAQRTLNERDSAHTKLAGGW